jgi:hypothetical protein
VGSASNSALAVLSKSVLPLTFSRRFLSSFFRKPPSCIALFPIGLVLAQGSAFPWWLLPLFIDQKQCRQAAFSKEISHFHSARLAKMEKRDPRQGVEATSMRCPRIPIAWRTMKRPMPRPSHRAGSKRVKASNIRGIWSPVMPIPVSYTSMRILWSVCRQPTRTRPPGCVYLIALLTKLRRTVPRSRALLSIVALVGTVRTLTPFVRAATLFA